MTLTPQHYPLFLVHLSEDGKPTVFPGIYAITGWTDHGDGTVPSPITVPLAGAGAPPSNATAYRFFHTYNAAVEYTAREQAAGR